VKNREKNLKKRSIQLRTLKFSKNKPCADKKREISIHKLPISIYLVKLDYCRNLIEIIMFLVTAKLIKQRLKYKRKNLRIKSRRNSIQLLIFASQTESFCNKIQKKRVEGERI